MKTGNLLKTTALGVLATAATLFSGAKNEVTAQNRYKKDNEGLKLEVFGGVSSRTTTALALQGRDEKIRAVTGGVDVLCEKNMKNYDGSVTFGAGFSAYNQGNTVQGFEGHALLGLKQEKLEERFQVGYQASKANNPQVLEDFSSATAEFALMKFLGNKGMFVKGLLGVEAMLSGKTRAYDERSGASEDYDWGRGSAVAPMVGFAVGIQMK